MNKVFGSNAHRGLTLVELLVAMTVFLAVIAISLSVLYSAQKAQRQLDKNFEVRQEIDRAMKKIERSLRHAEKLISGAKNSITFTNPTGDTIVYYVKNDTLFNNTKPLTMIPVDLLDFTYIKPIDNKKISDFFSLDSNMNGVLDNNETRAISGIELDIQFVPADRLTAPRIKKHIVVLLRNLHPF